jgi:alcohol dehydrogenase YqhD (iron-dependent ADH family)
LMCGALNMWLEGPMEMEISVLEPNFPFRTVHSHRTLVQGQCEVLIHICNDYWHLDQTGDIQARWHAPPPHDQLLQYFRQLVCKR